MAMTRINLENQTRDGAIEADSATTFTVYPFEYQVGSLVGTYAGSSGNALTPSQTNYVYLNDTGTLVTNTTGFPTGVSYIQLGTVVMTTVITAINNKRIFLASGGS